jgi:hypothetical protein
VYFNKSHKGVVEALTARRLKEELTGLHLLSFDFTGFKFDDTLLSQIDPKDGDVFEIKMALGDRLYIVGCHVESGIVEDQKFAGAMIPDFANHPTIACRLSEDASFRVNVKPAETF